MTPPKLAPIKIAKDRKDLRAGKKYYKGTKECTLFKSKGYSIKYESIRCTKVYQNLKVKL